MLILVLLAKCVCYSEKLGCCSGRIIHGCSYEGPDIDEKKRLSIPDCDRLDVDAIIERDTTLILFHIISMYSLIPNFDRRD